MTQLNSRAFSRWAVQMRSLKRGARPFIVFRPGKSLFETRSEARAFARTVRCYGVAATPIRVRVTVEAI